jgi:hypothetical protein
MRGILVPSLAAAPGSPNRRLATSLLWLKVCQKCASCTQGYSGSASAAARREAGEPRRFPLPRAGAILLNQRLRFPPMMIGFGERALKTHSALHRRCAEFSTSVVPQPSRAASMRRVSGAFPSRPGPRPRNPEPTGNGRFCHTRSAQWPFQIFSLEPSAFNSFHNLSDPIKHLYSDCFRCKKRQNRFLLLQSVVRIPCTSAGGYFLPSRHRANFCREHGLRTENLRFNYSLMGSSLLAMNFADQITTKVGSSLVPNVPLVSHGFPADKCNQLEKNSTVFEINLWPNRERLLKIP